MYLRDIKNDFETAPEWRAWLDCLSRYEGDSDKRDFTEKSLESMHNNIITAMRRFFRTVGRVYPQDVDYHHFRQYKKGSRDIKEYTVKKLLGYLGRMLAYNFGINPMDMMEVRWNTDDTKQRMWIFREEWDAIYSNATTAERVVLLLTAGMGLRRNEIATLKMSDIDGNILRFHGKGHGKGKFAEKEIPPSVLRAIRDYLPERDFLISKFGDRFGGSLLVTPYYSNGRNTLYRYVSELMASPLGG